MDYQLTGRGCRRLVRTTANVARVEELICSHSVAPSSAIKIKLASCHLLLYVLYLPKSFSFIDAFNCYKQQKLSYRKQIARKLRTQYVEGIHSPKYYTVTLKYRLRVTQGDWKRKHWTYTTYY